MFFHSMVRLARIYRFRVNTLACKKEKSKGLNHGELVLGNGRQRERIALGIGLT